jgi:two-component system chemotaxis response regulator CheY
VLLDLLMPKCSGIDALRAIRAIDPTAYVVACSALGQERLVAEAIFAGARDATLKPFHPVRLETALRRVQCKRLTPARAAA